MDMTTGRPNHIEDVLVTLNTGQWFGWSDSSNKVYANLTVASGHSKPTESTLTTKLAELQAAWDTENAAYRLNRAAEYPSIGDQLDMQYHDAVNGTTTWQDAIAAVKSKYAKS
jgi:hypothetical protein